MPDTVLIGVENTGGTRADPSPAHAPAFRPQGIGVTGDGSIGKRRATVGEVPSGTKTWGGREALWRRNTPTTSPRGSRREQCSELFTTANGLVIIT